MVCENRHEPFDTGCFTHAGIDPARRRFVLIKSRQHFRADFEPFIEHVVMAAGPGIITSGLRPSVLEGRPQANLPARSGYRVQLDLRLTES